MITRVAYEEVRYVNPETCIAAIRTYVERGWQVAHLAGVGRGPYLVRFRKLEETNLDPAAAVH